MQHTPAFSFTARMPALTSHHPAASLRGSAFVVRTRHTEGLRALAIMRDMTEDEVCLKWDDADVSLFNLAITRELQIGFVNTNVRYLPSLIG